VNNELKMIWKKVMALIEELSGHFLGFTEKNTKSSVEATVLWPRF
jgi:hypothetical protein